MEGMIENKPEKRKKIGYKFLSAGKNPSLFHRKETDTGSKWREERRKLFYAFCEFYYFFLIPFFVLLDLVIFQYIHFSF